MADISKRGPDCDNDGERGRRGKRGHTGPIGPTGPAAAEGPPFRPPFPEPTLIFIFANADIGNDVTGNGSAAKPYQSLPRATQDIPTNIDANVLYFINLTGDMPPLPVNYTLPAWKAPQTIVFNNFGLPLVLTGAVNIYADPVPVPLVPASDAVINASDVMSVTADPITGMQTITLNAMRASWGVDGLKGKQVFGPSVDDFHPTVAFANTTTTISIVSTDTIVYPLTVSQPGASLSSVNDDFNFVIQAYNVDSITFGNLKLHHGPNAFASLFVDGISQSMTQMCDIQSPAYQSIASEMTRFISNWCTGFPFFASTGQGTFFNHGLFDGLITAGSFIGYQSSPAMAFHNIVFDGCDPIEPAYTIDAFQPNVIANFSMTNSLIKNGRGPGIIFHGSYGQLNDVDIAANNGSGIVVNRGAGQLRLEDVGSSTPNANFGVEITDGMQVSADVVTTTTNPLAFRGLTGTLGGDILLGSVGPVAWGTVALPPNNVADYTNPGATGARISQS